LGSRIEVDDAMSDATLATWSLQPLFFRELLAVAQITLPTESYTYDGNDNLTQFTDRTGKVATFSYDGLNRRVSAAYGQTQSGGTLSTPDATVSTTYDAGSRPTQIIDSQGGTITRTYDGLDRLTAETTPQGSVSYAYDAANRRTSFQVTGQSAVSYAYDNADRLTTITQGGAQVGFNYDAGSRRSTLTLPNGIVATYSYDTANELTGISYANGGTVLGNLTYAYDNAGRRVQIGGSLASMALPAALTSATYDAGNRLTNWAGTALAYDANGNLTADGSLGYGWDSRNRLVALTGAATASFVYDAVGRRSGKTINGTTTNFLYDGANAVQELAGGTPVAVIFRRVRFRRSANLRARRCDPPSAASGTSARDRTSSTIEQRGYGRPPRLAKR
jgi:YD repeat-containing protein